MQPTFSFWGSVLAFSAVKILFINSYRSTDFEVHRNWLGITHSLPVERWYYDSTSEWTLDYPPFFAYFEWVLAQVAKWVDPRMVELSSLNYASRSAILFQKLSVIFADLVLAFSITVYADTLKGNQERKKLSLVLFVLIFMNTGLFIVDQIHFQYNGFLFGILLLSIGSILQEKYFLGSFFFAVLLNFKHIFLYMAPAFGVYLFSKCCIQKSRFPIKLGTLIGFAAIVISVFSFSFGPFHQHVPQIMKRLFPFKRGLSHAYWAPNVWAIYNTLDLGISVLTGKKKSSLTGGLVGENSLVTLPQIQPMHTFFLTLLFMLPILYQIWKAPTHRRFLDGIILTAWTSFMFGYHVHEKAILNVIIPFSLVCVVGPDKDLFIMTLVSGTVSLFPLLFTPFESVIKILLTIFHIAIIFELVMPIPKFKWYELIYFFGFVPLNFSEIFCSFYLPGYPFLPLICFSDYCFIGLFYSYVKFYFRQR